MERSIAQTAVVLFAAIFLYLTFLPGSLEPEIEQRLLLLAFFVGMGLLVILMCLVCTRRLSKYRVVRGCCGLFSVRWCGSYISFVAVMAVELALMEVINVLGLLVAFGISFLVWVALTPLPSYGPALPEDDDMAAPAAQVASQRRKVQ